MLGIGKQLYSPLKPQALNSQKPSTHASMTPRALNPKSKAPPSPEEPPSRLLALSGARSVSEIRQPEAQEDNWSMLPCGCGKSQAFFGTWEFLSVCEIRSPLLTALSYLSPSRKERLVRKPLRGLTASRHPVSQFWERFRGQGYEQTYMARQRLFPQGGSRKFASQCQRTPYRR